MARKKVLLHKPEEKYVSKVSPEISRPLASHRYKQLNLLINFFITSGPEIEHQVALNIALELAHQILPYDKGIIYLEEDTGRLRAYAFKGFAKLPPALERGNLFSTWVMNLGKPILIPHEGEVEVNEALAQVGALSMLAVPMFRGDRLTGVFQLFSHARNFFSREDVQLIWILTLHLENLLARIEERETATRLGIADPLTGTYNRNYFERALRSELSWSVRKGVPLSILMLDIDGFRRFNERYKHRQGNQALRDIGAILRRECRQSDIPARLVADQFAVILPEADEAEALVVAKRLSSAIAAHRFTGHPGGRKVGLTVSIGSCTFPSDRRELDELVQGAEQALARAKREGRSQILQFSQLPILELYPKFYRRIMDFSQVAQAVKLAFNFDSLLELLVRLAMEGMEAHRCSLMVRDRATGDLIIKVGHGLRFYDGSMETVRVRMGEGVAGWVAQQKTPLVATDVREVPGPRARDGRGYLNYSCMVVPLISAGETLGVLSISNKANRGVFTQEDLKLFGPMARILADFLRKGTRFREEQEDFARLAILSLAELAEAKIKVRGDHSKRVAKYAVAIAKEMSLSPAFIGGLRLSAELHDIGFLCINDEILRKRGRLNQQELAETRRHPSLGWKLLSTIPHLNEELDNILYHHERFDGSGYPAGKSGEEIPLGARILAVADVFEAMTSNRPHREALRKEEATNEIVANAGIKFDPQVVAAFSRAI